MQINQRARYIVGLALFLVLLATACAAEPTSTPTPTVLPTPTTTATPLQELVGRFFGTAIGLEGTATTAGGDQIAIELRNASDAELVKRLIGKRANLVLKERTCSDPLCQEFTDSDTLITGADLANAFFSTDPVGVGWVVNLQFDSRGADIFSELTGRIFTQQDTKRIAIFLDDDELIAPVARSWIRDGQVQITGNFSREEARTLAIQLESGRLPVALELISEEVR